MAHAPVTICASCEGPTRFRPVRAYSPVEGGGGGGRGLGAPLSISPPQNLAHRLQHVLILWSIFFPLNSCLVSRGSFGFVFVWVLVLSFTYAMYELIFLVGSLLFLACVQTDVCTQASLFSGRFFSECVEFPLSLFPIRSGMLYL